MSAVRKLQYDPIDHPVDVSRQTSTYKKPSKKNNDASRLVGMATVVVLACCLIVLGSFVLNRYARVAALSYNITQHKLDLGKYEQTANELMMQVEAQSSLDDVKTYAITTLNMVEVPLDNRVKLKANPAYMVPIKTGLLTRAKVEVETRNVFAEAVILIRDRLRLPTTP